MLDTQPRYLSFLLAFVSTAGCANNPLHELSPPTTPADSPITAPVHPPIIDIDSLTQNLQTLPNANPGLVGFFKDLDGTAPRTESDRIILQTLCEIVRCNHHQEMGIIDLPQLTSCLQTRQHDPFLSPASLQSYEQLSDTHNCCQTVAGEVNKLTRSCQLFEELLIGQFSKDISPMVLNAAISRGEVRIDIENPSPFVELCANYNDMRHRAWALDRYRVLLTTYLETDILAKLPQDRQILLLGALFDHASAYVHEHKQPIAEVSPNLLREPISELVISICNTVEDPAAFRALVELINQSKWSLKDSAGYTLAQNLETLLDQQWCDQYVPHKRDMVSSVLQRLVDPLIIQQCEAGTCSVLPLEVMLFRDFPAEAVKVLMGITSVYQGGSIFNVPFTGESLARDDSAAPPTHLGRKLLDAALQSAFMERGNGPEDYDPEDPRQGLNLDQMRDFYTRLFPERRYYITVVSKESELVPYETKLVPYQTIGIFPLYDELHAVLYTGGPGNQFYNGQGGTAKPFYYLEEMPEPTILITPETEDYQSLLRQD